MAFHLRDSALNRMVLSRIFLLTILFVGIGMTASWDYSNVDKDFSELKALLQDMRYRAITLDKTIVVRFSGKMVKVTDGKTDEIIRVLMIPTLHQVNYDTTLGDDMIVFDGHGTGPFNKRVHGGDIRLKSYLGFRKSLAVNCTGLVTEGLYPEE